MSDLFENTARKAETYSAQDIEVLEGLEPVRRRPGMYIGGTDDRALHHLVAEVLDNAMDEAVAGHASRIDLELGADGSVTVRDNGRGIPIDDHPKYPGKSALEVILTTLHSGGKFSNKVYQTSGGLHGVGLSVVNALSDQLIIEVARERQLFIQHYSRGTPLGPLTRQGAINRRGTTVRFHPDAEIFGEAAHFEPHRLYRMARSKAYLYRGVEIRWSCDPSLLSAESTTPAAETLHFPNGLLDYLTTALKDRKTLTPSPFTGEVALPNDQGRVEWAISWPEDEEGFSHTYCNTVPTPQGGTHETGLRAALTRGLKGYGEMVNNKRAGQITADDVVGEACILLSVFIREPQFQGQTKDKLATPEAQRLVEAALKDRFDHWLSGDPASSNGLLERLIEKAEDRAKRKQSKDLARKTATRRLRLPGKLADCSRNAPEGTEIFLVEGDSAGGSAKQARNRETQAILPLRGKILNVASASADKMKANQELNDLTQALGCGIGKDFSSDKLRYERVIIMTDADVDGAHIASLLMTFFYREMGGLIQNGHLYLALPPLYRISHGGKSVYARDDAHKDELMAKTFKNKKVEISRFKGLGEMMPAQLRDTTMDPGKRTLLRVVVPNAADPEEHEDFERTKTLVESLMGRRPELRFQFIQENAKFVQEGDIDV
ncbi:DNA topoisomerase IV subunit B [Azospirillum sp. TSO22-1]|uniref:DNA topoisomerase IV subunit B n=1 Tax=Azospirillum sp. TSO22-1 TaxID=716789 RepID=UPI000D60FFB0|nr:DNA topoisomerase IV subunit B [Azospirillum sp. TSO22-1]PWC55626.1 DNA topoisomerase IV [Azospirillum sp. TSO22-1]